MEKYEKIYQKNRPYGQITKVILLRHAESDLNVKKIYDSSNTSSLTPKGQEQAQELVDKLERESVDIIYSSPFKRCEQTILPFASKYKIPIVYKEGLRELDAGDFDQKPRNPELRKKRLADLSFPMPGGESMGDVINRSAEVLKEICRENAGKTVIVVTHGSTCRAIRYNIFDGAPETLSPDIIAEKASPETLYVESYSQIHITENSSYYKINHLNHIAKNVLGIHGWTGGPHNSHGKWRIYDKVLYEQGVTLDVPQFDQSKNTSYAIWKKDMEKLNWDKYDTFIGHSFGAPVLAEYVLEKNISGKRLILGAPSALTGNEYLEKTIPEFVQDKKRLSELFDEVIITHSQDDESLSAPFSHGEKLAQDIGANFIATDGVGHGFRTYHGAPLMTSLIKHGIPNILSADI